METILNGGWVFLLVCVAAFIGLMVGVLIMAVLFISKFNPLNPLRGVEMPKVLKKAR